MNRTLASSPDQVVIDHNFGRAYEGVNRTPLLSVKCMFGGPARYVSDGRREFIVDDSCYVILNEGNAYSVQKRSPTIVETFCVFFPAGMSATVARDLTSEDAQLLDAPTPTAAAFNFLEHRRGHGDRVSRHCLDLRAGIRSHAMSDAWLEERLLALLNAMLLDEPRVLRRIGKLSAARAPTRLEIFRRVQRGCDYLHANLDRSLALAAVANAAAMSPYHFLRSFRQVFGMTPFAYLASIRLQRAAQLLARSRLPVSEIAASVGCESPQSFSARFKQTYGVNPSQFRASAGRN